MQPSEFNAPFIKTSIVMPMFNANRTIARAIGSVQRQTRGDWELIVVDDASTDECCAVVEKMAREDSRIRLIKLPKNSGAGVARNAAIESAKGQFVAFLDADDEWLPEKLEKQIGWMETNDMAFSCTVYERVRPNGNRKFIEVPRNSMWRQLLKNNTVATLTAIYDRSKYGDVRMPEIRRRQDYAFWLKLLESTDYVYGLNEALAINHCHPTNLLRRVINGASIQRY